MDIWLFGNPDLSEDSLPLQMLPRLRQAFPHSTFTVQDPLDEWRLPGELFIIDTVKGIDCVRAFGSLDEFQEAPRVTMHDFDAVMELRLLQKLGKLPALKIFGVPPTLSMDEAFGQLSALLRDAGA